jgi:predicted dienelactone hydrolase
MLNLRTIAFAEQLVAFALLVGACSLPAGAHGQASSFEFLEKPGPYPVGLKVVEQYDPSRRFPVPADAARSSPGEGARPLQTLVWYPSSTVAKHPMTVGDYAALTESEVDFHSKAKNTRWEKLLSASYSSLLRAQRDTGLAAGRFPVVIYAPGDSSISWDNADLCEYLASHGYVVVASPSMGASTRDMTDDLEGISAEARDISFLISYAATLPDVDSSKVAVIGWSWGAISNLFAAARDSRIDALVALDGSMRYFPGLVKRAADVHPDQMTIPLLFFKGDNSSLLEARDAYGADTVDIVGPNVLNAWKRGDLLIVDMVGMSHPEFASMYERRHNAAQFAENQVADYGWDDANLGYVWVARYTLKFIDAYLKQDASAKLFLQHKPAENGVPKHVMGIEVHPAKSGH